VAAAALSRSMFALCGNQPNLERPCFQANSAPISTIASAWCYISSPCGEREDVDMLAQEFLRRFNQEHGVSLSCQARHGCVSL